MKQQIYWKSLKMRSLCLMLAALSLNGCFLKQDRTTTVYGTVVDESRQPLKNIPVLVSGIKGFNQGERLHDLKTDEKGEYNLTFDVPKGFRNIDVGLTYISTMDYAKKYKGVLVYKEGNQTQDCCLALIGKKTKYDFILLFK